MDTLLLCFSSLMFLLLTLIIYFCLYHFKKISNWSLRGTNKNTLLVLFIDAPDPDNPAAAVAIIRHILNDKLTGKADKLHIVLTGRPVDFRTAKTFQDDLSISDQIPRQSWEKNSMSHAELLLEDSAARISGYLTNCNVNPSSVTIYNGSIAPYAPLSDMAHDWDFLFDRKDLITGQQLDQGKILTPSEYQCLISKFNKLSSDERENQFISLMRPYKLTPLYELQEKIKLKSCEQIIIYLGGPATAVVELFQGMGKAKMRQKVSEFYGMFGALKPGMITLLENQFNVACDIESANILFVDNLFPNIQKYLITTETAKNKDLIITAKELEEIGVNTHVVKLQKLWESTHYNRAQPLFDVLPVMASLEKYRSNFKWSMKKAILMESWKSKNEIRKRFCFVGSDSDHLLVSQDSLESLVKEDFLQFLQQIWC